MQLMANQGTSAFSRSLAIVNSDADSPVLFLHLEVDPKSKKVSGECEMIKTGIKPSCSSKTELSGDYKSMDVIHEGHQHLVNLLGYTAYDQICPAIKITLVTDANWKNGKVFYEYLEEGTWLKLEDLNLKIR